MVDKWVISGSPTRAHAPQPLIGAREVPLDQVLSWKTGVNPDDPNVPNPAITGHYLWLSPAYNPINPPSTDGWWNNPDVQTIPIDLGAGTTGSYTPAGLQRDAFYYWLVDESLGASGPLDADNLILGATWKFETISSAPDVEAGSNIVTWLKEGATTVDLNGTVTDISGDVATIAWSVISEPNVATTSIANSSAAATTATLTETGTYVLELYAKDAAQNEDSDQVEINVYADSCDAAQNNPNGYTAPAGDMNNDCKVDFVDFATLAGTWLEDESLIEDALYDPN